MKARGTKAAAISILVIACACRSSVVSRDSPSPSSETFTYGSDLEVESSPSPTAPASSSQGGTGKAEINVRDQNGLGPQGIVVDFVGPRVERLKSNSDGKVVVDLDPGIYDVSVPSGCDDAIQVLWGGKGRLSIVGGKTTKGSISVSWQHRYRPWPPADSSLVPWPVGEEIRVQFYVVDKCNDNSRSPGATYPSFTFESVLLEITRVPSHKADEDGLGVVYVRCRDKGKPNLLSIDTKNRSDVVDLTKEDVSTGVDMQCT